MLSFQRIWKATLCNGSVVTIYEKTRDSLLRCNVTQPLNTCVVLEAKKEECYSFEWKLDKQHNNSKYDIRKTCESKDLDPQACGDSLLLVHNQSKPIMKMKNRRALIIHIRGVTQSMDMSHLRLEAHT